MSTGARQLAISLGAAITAEVITSGVVGTGSPTRWLLAQLVAMPAPTVGPAVAVVAVALVVVANSIVIGRRFLDDDAPLAGRIGVGLILGLPLAAFELSVLAALWLVLRPG